MRRTRNILACLAALGLVGLLAPPVSFAGGPSAGDQQYVDPLGGSSTNTSSQPTKTTAPSTTSTSAPAPAPPAPAASTSSAGSSSSSGPSSSSTADAATATARTLPFTGFNAWLGAGAGLVLVVGGVFLRRTLARG